MDTATRVRRTSIRYPRARFQVVVIPLLAVIAV
jgi:hypothetical protein